MKRTPLAKRRRRRNGSARQANGATRGFSSPDEAIVLPELDRGVDGCWRDLVGRIARGDRIRGHAL